MLKNFQLPITFFLTFLVSSLHAASLKTLSLDFNRQLKEVPLNVKDAEKGKVERTEGTLHYDVKAKRVVVEVTEPLMQIMIVKGKVLEIYYPVQKEAFRFISRGRIPLPFIEAILQATQAEYGLTAVGYSLEKHDIKDDVLYTHWVPPDEEKDKLGTVILRMRDDFLISAEVKNPDGNLAASSRYQRHRKLGNYNIPMEVTSSLYGPKSELLQHEHIIYSNPRMNQEPLNPILDFTIPESVKVKEVKW